MKWISVKIKMPDDCEPVLCCFTGWDDMQFMRVLEYDVDCREWSDWNGVPHTEITHWAELPKLPKEFT